MRLLKERRGNEIVRNMHSNFAKETNQRDEDAEMQKFIEEQVRLKKRAERLAAAAAAAAAAGESSSTTATPPERLLAGGDNDDDDDLDNFEEDLTGTATAADGGDSAERPAPKKKFKSPSDALFDVPKYLIESQSKAKTVELLSDQMLSGIPEVDLGVEERMRNIEDTERAKQALLVGKQAKQNDRRFASVIGGTGGDVSAQYAPHNTSVNFVQHKRFDDALINPEHMIRPRMPTNQTRRNTEREPVVGDAPKHELLIAAAHAAKAGASSGGRGGRGAGGRGFRGKRHGGGGSSAGGDPEKEAEIAARRAAAAARRAANGGSNVPVERASDDLCWERFKRNVSLFFIFCFFFFFLEIARMTKCNACFFFSLQMRYNNRRSKIKIA